MDFLSRLLETSRVRGVVDFRCYLAGAFDIDHDVLPPGEAAFHLVMAGRGKVVLPGGDCLDIEPGDLLVFVRDGRHRVSGNQAAGRSGAVSMSRDGPFVTKRNTTGDADLDLLCGRFVTHSPRQGMLFDALPDVLHIRLTVDHTLASMTGLVEIIRRELASGDMGSPAVVEAMCEALLVFALRWRIRAGKLPPSLLSVMAEPRLAHAIEAVLADPSHEWTVGELAAHAAMSRATFARHFEAVAGATPLDIVTRIRLDIACELLRTTRAPVGEVGEQVGYRSEAAFSRVFSKLVGVSPARYRRGVQEQGGTHAG